MPDAPGLELIAQEIDAAHEGTVVETSHERGVGTLIVNPERLLDALRWLRDAPGQEYRFLSSLHAADYLPAEPRFAVHYELLCMPRVERVHVKALLRDPAAGNGRPWVGGAGPEPGTPPGQEAEGAPVDVLPEIDSCVELFPTAEFQEREAYDMFGIRFRGHPDLRRILMPEDYVGWPQRRDFPLGGEAVLFTHNEVELPRWYE
jgi:NADH-quinone oxidoreductase subunit C